MCWCTLKNAAPQLVYGGLGTNGKPSITIGSHLDTVPADFAVSRRRVDDRIAPEDHVPAGTQHVEDNL